MSRAVHAAVTSRAHALGMSAIEAMAIVGVAFLLVFVTHRVVG